MNIERLLDDIALERMGKEVARERYTTRMRYERVKQSKRSYDKFNGYISNTKEPN